MFLVIPTSAEKFLKLNTVLNALLIDITSPSQMSGCALCTANPMYYIYSTNIFVL